MKIKLTNLGKRYNRQWIFRNINLEFNANKHYAITGPNGSGKSTLLQVIGGAVTHNEGSIAYSEENILLPSENIFTKISITAPYLDVVEEMTLYEFFSFHKKMKGWINDVPTDKIIEIIHLEKFSSMPILYFSTGMKQRVKLAQAIFSNVSLILLDEPATNLDEEGISLYNFLIKNYCHNRIVIVSSNDKNEYSFCEEKIDMMNYK